MIHPERCISMKNKPKEPLALGQYNGEHTGMQEFLCVLTHFAHFFTKKQKKKLPARKYPAGSFFTLIQYPSSLIYNKGYFSVNFFTIAAASGTFSSPPLITSAIASAI